MGDEEASSAFAAIWLWRLILVALVMLALTSCSLLLSLPHVSPAESPTLMLAAPAASDMTTQPEAAVVALPQPSPNPILPDRPPDPVAPTASPTSLPTRSPRPAARQPAATPTPRPPGTPPRVGLHVGHWQAADLPDELARLRGSVGAVVDGYREVDINMDVAGRVATLLQARGISVDVLPATVPPGYDADAFVAIHADGSENRARRGFKLATPWRTSRASQHLHDTLRAEYAALTGLPWDDAITVNMRGYYAFNYNRHEHVIARTTPAVIIEMGFLSNSTDRAFLLEQPHIAALAITNGIERYVNERDPTDGAALLPPEFDRRTVNENGSILVRAAPRLDAAVLLQAGAGARIVPFQEREGWYQVFARDGDEGGVGWALRQEVLANSRTGATPPPSSNP